MINASRQTTTKTDTLPVCIMPIYNKPHINTSTWTPDGNRFKTAVHPGLTQNTCTCESQAHAASSCKTKTGALSVHTVGISSQQMHQCKGTHVIIQLMYTGWKVQGTGADSHVVLHKCKWIMQSATTLLGCAMPSIASIRRHPLPLSIPPPFLPRRNAPSHLCHHTFPSHLLVQSQHQGVAVGLRGAYVNTDL